MSLDVQSTVVDSLDHLLSEDCTIDSWYDEGVSFAHELLDEFKDVDWSNIISISKNRNTEWKKKLVYCIHGDYNQGLDLIKEFLRINDTELKEMCIDSLRDYDALILRKFISENKDVFDVLYKINSMDGTMCKIVQNYLMHKLNPLD